MSAEKATEATICLIHQKNIRTNICHITLYQIMPDGLGSISGASNTSDHRIKHADSTTYFIETKGDSDDILREDGALKDSQSKIVHCV